MAAIILFILFSFSGGVILWLFTGFLAPEQPDFSKCLLASFLTQLISLFGIPLLPDLIILAFLLGYAKMRGLSSLVSVGIFRVALAIVMFLLLSLASLTQPAPAQPSYQHGYVIEGNPQM
jgi:hypothetical protein